MGHAKERRVGEQSIRDSLHIAGVGMIVIETEQDKFLALVIKRVACAKREIKLCRADSIELAVGKATQLAMLCRPAKEICDAFECRHTRTICINVIGQLEARFAQLFAITAQNEG